MLKITSFEQADKIRNYDLHCCDVVNFEFTGWV